MNIWAIILAAGQSTRLAACGLSQKKQFLEYQGIPLFWHSVMTFARTSAVSGIIITFPPQEFNECREMTAKLKAASQPGVPVRCSPGGSLRQESVYNGLMSLPRECSHVMVHDAARPFFTAGLVHELKSALEPGLGGVIPVLPCRDTVKIVQDCMVVSTLNRDELAMVQTPQFFPRDKLVDSHDMAAREHFLATDDASMVEKSGFRVKTVPGQDKNIKITTIEDLKTLENTTGQARPCTGLGYDVHRYGGPRPMVLGGIPIPGAPGIFAHSDGDVLIHALVDAILGCMGRGDIGDLYPDSDPRNEGLSSTVFLSEVLIMARRENLELKHVDITLIAQVPKLSPFKDQIRSSLAGLTGLSPDQVNIKATTEEKLGFTGARQGIKTMAVVTAVKHQNVASGC